MMLFLGSAGLALARDFNITMGDNFFEPATLTIAVGDRVTWTHTGNRPHDVTSDDGTLNSPRRMSNGQTYAYTATKPGTFAYICTIHPAQMRATLVVQGAAGGGGGGVAMPRTGGGGMAGDLATDSLLFGSGLALLFGVGAASAWRRYVVG
jgi:plastocyanin